MVGKAACALVGLVLGTAVAAKAETPSPGFAADVAVLVEKTGAFALGDAIVEQFLEPMLRSIKAANPAIPDAFLALFREEMQAEIEANREAILAEVTEIYARHFSHDDIKALIAFYETDLGKKAVVAMPLVARETMQAMQDIGAAMSARAVERAKHRFEASRR